MESITYFLKILQNIETSIEILGCVQRSQSYLMETRNFETRNFLPESNQPISTSVFGRDHSEFISEIITACRNNSIAEFYQSVSKSYQKFFYSRFECYHIFNPSRPNLGRREKLY